MELFHYIYIDKDGSLSRVMTTSPVPNTMRACYTSMLKKMVVPVNPKDPTGARLLTLDTGEWKFPVLERAMRKGVEFHIQSWALSEIAKWDPIYLEDRIGKSNFAFATPKNLILFKFANHSGFDLRPLGIDIDNTKKLVKRLGEVIRLSGHAHLDEYAELGTLEYETPEDREDVDFDGMNVISRTLAELVNFKGDRGWLRVLTEKGLIKGDFVVREDDFFPKGVHVLYHTENLKPELATTGWQLVMVMKHGPSYSQNHNDQIRFMVPSVFTRDRMESDLKYLVADWWRSIKEDDGELNEYLASTQGAFDDPVAVDLRAMDRLADRLEDQARLLQTVGIPPAVLSNIAFSRTGALARKLEAGRMKDPNGRYMNHFKRMPILATHAFAGAIISWAAYHEMAGLNYGKPDDEGNYVEDGSRTFYNSRYGLVMPTQRFRDTYHLHGGFDQDDTIGMFDYDFWSSDPGHVALLKEHKVIDPALEIPDNPEDAVPAALTIRMPMGPGEYSIESVSPDMPWKHVKDIKRRVIDVATLPLPSDLVFVDADPVELVGSVDYAAEFDRTFALNMVRAQMINPNVGQYANLIMAAASIFGPDNIPAGVKTLKMEETIDTVQQEADALKFTTISNAVTSGWIALVDRVLDTQTKVDNGVLVTRIPREILIGEETIPIAQAIIDAKLVFEGDTGFMHKRMVQAIDHLRKNAEAITKKNRNETALALKVARYKVPKELRTFAIGWLRGCNGALKNVDKKFRELRREFEGEDSLNAIIRRELQIQHRVAIEELMDKYVDEIINNKRYDTLLQVMALYFVIITSKSEAHPFGDNDRVLVTPSSEDHISITELFIRACIQFNLVTRDVTLLHPSYIQDES